MQTQDISQSTFFFFKRQNRATTVNTFPLEMGPKRLLESYESNDSRSSSNDWKKKGVGEVRTSLP